jgi:hypothetical protein
VVDLMNFATDDDLYVGWASAVVHGKMKPVERRYNAGAIFKRARGVGRITRVDGLDRLMAEFGDYVVLIDLLPVGAPRRDWRSTVTGDGMVIVRHPEFQRVVEMTDRFAADFQLYAG